MQNLRLRILMVTISFAFIGGVTQLSEAASPRRTSHSSPKQRKRATVSTPRTAASPYRGWDYLVSRLRENGVDEPTLRQVYGDPRMPERTFVPFSVKPREPSSIYESFKRPEHGLTGAAFIDRHRQVFEAVEAKLMVPKEVIAAIIVVESQAGKVTGNHLVVYRLSRLATTNAPDNLQLNYVEQKSKDHRVTFSDVRRRGRYLERTFLPEIPALITLAKRSSVDVLSIKGSSAGAMGLPQFLPSAVLRYGLDGNRDGAISLHHEHDAIWSTANYLAHFGFRKSIPLQEKRAIIWRYNKSKSYIDTVLSLSKTIEGHGSPPVSFSLDE
jgi:membrane-bound lytic murein transglycosylase B